MKVPFIDLKTQHESIKDEIAVAIEQVINSCAFAGGPFVEQFEKKFAEFCRSENAIAVGSGTEALWLALLGLGIAPGDEVITVPNTFMATAEAISFCGARPIFVDIDRETYNLDPVLLEKAITPRTKAIIPVHLFGQMADMDPIMEIAKGHKLFVVEDACQAHGAEYKGKAAGSIGDAGCFSFYPGKNLGAYGEAGAVIAYNTGTDRDIRMLRDHGQSRKYHHAMIGWNARMDGLQGSVLSVKLRHLRNWNKSRRNNAQLYNEQLSNIDGIIVPKEADYASHVYHIYAVRVHERDAFISNLAKKDIYCGIHYPVPIHLTKAYKFCGYEIGSFPVSEKMAKELVSLPMFPELKPVQVDYVVKNIKQILKTSD